MMACEGARVWFELRLMRSFILSALPTYVWDHAYVLWCVHVYQSIYREARSSLFLARASLFLSLSRPSRLNFGTRTRLDR